jgi:hypothetical protein
MADGTQAGALAWWATVAPGGKVPAVWTQGAGARVVNSGDGVYLFAGQSNADGSGYGNVSWNQGSPPQSQQMYVRWGTDGLTSNGTGTGSAPAPVDPGQVTPVQPFGNLDWTSSLGTLLGNLTDKALWVRIGEGALAVLILGIGFYLLLKKEGFVNGTPGV